MGGVSCPKIYSLEGESVLHIKIKNTKYRLILMEYINGKDFFSSNSLPDDNDLEKIATEMAKLNQIAYKPPFIYDYWAIINFIPEYEKNINLIQDQYKKKIDIAYQIFKKCDFDKLKWGFVHGDIIETNVIKDNDGKIYFIDFSVSNYMPRIVDLAVTICDLCLDLEDIESSRKRASLYLEAYQQNNKLTEYEKECLMIFLICHQAITILETTREKVIDKNNSYENEQFLKKGQLGLDIVLEDSKIKALLQKIL